MFTQYLARSWPSAEHTAVLKKRGRYYEEMEEIDRVKSQLIIVPEAIRDDARNCTSAVHCGRCDPTTNMCGNKKKTLLQDGVNR